ncbi:MAG TPA: ATP-dependent metallopeptidase FtsH/Yme1/Tma family protein, partial [Myxococcaceae bacterium]|nr:ATP-dependent metallopeptidase FtsH/Yme1/Tma family protein [Myxococcaceae bacterium]
MRSSYKTIGLWVILIVLFVAFYNIFSQGAEDVQEPTWTTFRNKVDEGKVKSISVKGNVYSGVFGDNNEKFRVNGPAPEFSVLEELKNQKVDVKIDREEQNSLWLTILSQWMPVVFLFLFFIFFMRQLQGSGGKAMTFGKSKAKLLSESHNK